MDWEIYDGVQQRGPMPEAGVFDAIRSGLPRNAYVRQAGTSDWLPVETHPLFATAVQHRGAPGHWAPPPPPPPPPMVGAPPPPQPEVQRPPPGTAYAVSPHAGKPAKRQLVLGGCLVQVLGAALMLGAGAGLYFALMLPVVAGLAGVGLLLLLVGGLLQRRWVCSLCKQPVGGRAVFVCPSCHAALT
jgi:hypothetical protein